MIAHSKVWQRDVLTAALNSSPCGPLPRDCVGVFMTSQPASPRVSDSRDSKVQAVYIFFVCDIASKVTFHHLCNFLLAT